MSIKVLVAFALSLFLAIPAVSFAGEDEDALRDLFGVFTMRELMLRTKKGGVTVVANSGAFVTKKIVLDNKRVQEVTLYKRDPVGSNLAQWPTVFVLTGLGNAEETLSLLPEVPDMSVVVLEYPVDLSGTAADASVQLAKNIIKIEAQIVGTYLWLEQQTEVDSSKIISLNISLGTFLAPTALRLLSDISVPGDELNQHYPALTIFAFGGADLQPFIDESITDSDMNRILNDGAKLVKGLKNFKRLRGPFLVIQATDDQVIPKASADSLFDQLPDPKDRVFLEAGHVNAKKPEIAQQAFNVISTWLKAQGFLQ